MPTFRHGRGTALLLDDEDVSVFFREAAINRTVDLAETSTYGTFDKTYVVGMRDATFTLAGLFSGGSDEIDAQLAGIIGQEAEYAFTYAPEGLTLGRRLYVAAVDNINYEVSSPLTDMVGTSAEFQASGGAFGGVSLHALTSESTTNNGTSVDNGASSAQGGIATLHLTANNRDAGSILVKVQHSTDNSVWNDLITFSSVNFAVTSGQVLSVAGTVNRYTRAQWTVTGGTTGGYTFAVGFARKT